ncbi:SDR family NAD(P)-dependent oxidoreductase [Kallipyga gabonensis]|uniref:SDR family NAD(P)-dependent oxidoreductase n=1 Tax=Kallipyga gabonensis TaxID=1686287 RepID=UPI0006B599C1|nr:SDR family NAD(P)-dependent oxidoreductase [Kallipyga gabonensis]
MRVALITGASSGLGWKLAELVDRQEKMDEIWLLARREGRLRDLEGGLTTPCRLLPWDMSGEEWAGKLKDLLDKERPDMALVINNAGIGKAGAFEDLDGGHIQTLLDLNIRGLTLSTHICLPFMGQGGRIVNIASVAAFLPQPGLGIYSASKSYVLSFSRALHREVRKRGISVTAVCPNPMMTEFFDLSGGIGPTGLKRLGLDSVDRVAQKALDRSRRGKDLSITHPTAYVIRFFSKILPHSFVLWLEGLMGFY